MFRIFPLSNQNAKTVAKSLVDRFITKCGCPSEIHTDQGKNISSKLYDAWQRSNSANRSDTWYSRFLPEYVSDVGTNISECYEIARQNIFGSQRRQKQYYDSYMYLYQNVHTVQEKVGQSPKSKYIWKGAYEVSDVTSSVLYRQVDKRGKKSIVHHDRIKLCRDLEHPRWIKTIRSQIPNDSEMISRKSPEAEISEDDKMSCLGNLFDTVLCVGFFMLTPSSTLNQSSPDQDQHGSKIKRTRKPPTIFVRLYSGPVLCKYFYIFTFMHQAPD